MKKEQCFSIALNNTTGSPVEYVLFADNSRLSEAAGTTPVPDFMAIAGQMSALYTLHGQMSVDFQVLQDEQTAATLGGRSTVFDFTPLVTKMTTSADRFLDLRNTFATLTGGGSTSTAPSVIAQIAREIAIQPIIVNEITLNTANIEQVQQLYTCEKKLILREGENKVIDFWSKYKPELKKPQVVLYEQDFGGVLRFDGTTGFRFTLLPNTSISLKFCYEFAPPPVCCTPSPAPKEIKPLPTPSPTNKKSVSGGSPKPQEETPKPKEEKQPPKPINWLVASLVGLGLLLLLVFVVCSRQAK